MGFVLGDCDIVVVVEITNAQCIEPTGGTQTYNTWRRFDLVFGGFKRRDTRINQSRIESHHCLFSSDSTLFFIVWVLQYHSRISREQKRHAGAKTKLVP